MSDLTSLGNPSTRGRGWPKWNQAPGTGDHAELSHIQVSGGCYGA